MSTAGSDVAITVQKPGGSEVDISNHAVIADASFDAAAGATAGLATVSLRDMDRELIAANFPTGSRLKCIIDDQPMWSGFMLRRGRTSFFPAGDGKEDTKSRKFVLYGVDNNILLDKRVLRDTSHYLRAIPTIMTATYDGELLRTMLSTYADMPDWLDISSQIDDIYQHPDSVDISNNQGWAYVEQGSRIRAQFEDLAAASGAVYSIRPDDAVHYHALQSVESPWGFSDRPNRAPITGVGGFEGAYWGFREMNADEDGSQFATDAFVWGGSPFASGGTVVFSRATDTDLEDEHGKWQLPELHFNEKNFKTQKTVDQRANVIVFGNPDGTPGTGTPGSVVGEGPRGLRYPQWAYQFSWTTRDVPSISGVPRHLYPGDIVPIQLWAFSEDDGVTPFTKFLPLRTLQIRFPSGAKNGKAHVAFSGTFDLRNEDPFSLWKFLRAREPKIVTTDLPTSDDTTTDFVYGSYGRFTPSPTPDGSTSVFTIPVGYIPGTTIVFMKTSAADGGLALRPSPAGSPGTGDYDESDSDAGEITLNVSPLPDDGSGDWLLVTCRTLAG